MERHQEHSGTNLLNENKAAEYLGLSVRTLQAWRVRGGGPTFVKAGRAVRYRPDDLNAWINERMATSTSALEVRT
ncbi:helix-turn-helix transcriptional regulator [Roseibium alexandrii]|uniref:Helix-turn-helix domain protein n=1 Tax=Roseibium alexandrii TaxID=388408 RepID=A0A0M7A3P7_9HYPH|nr:helix-turn-helix domain-containing protein [Roseibium alexandrii]CTQ69499.1 Helix-turn-helix domain protein [Roseibium alexandrii]